MDLPDEVHDGRQVEKRWKERVGFEGHDEGDVQRAGDATRTINGKEDLWNPPPGRESQLDVVKKGSAYDLRAYCGMKKPSKLYEDEDLRYQVPPEEASVEKAKELEEERREIIRDQAVKKRIAIAERRGSVERLEDSPVGNVTKPGSDVHIDNSSCKRTSTAPQNVVREQIDFAAARQQFLELEKKNPEVLSRNNTPRSVGHGDEPQRPPTREETSPSDGALGVSRERTWPRKGPSVQVQDPPGGNQCDLETPPREVKSTAMGGGDTSRRSGESPDAPDLVGKWEEETPIEREIRLAQEREEDLWKERGLAPRANAREELVQIQTRPLLSAPVPLRKGKGRRPVSFHFQREMDQETRREEALPRGGRPPGPCSCGGTQDLAQRRKVFEAPPGEPRETPDGGETPHFQGPSLENHNGGGTGPQKWTRLTTVAPDFGQGRPGSRKMSHPGPTPPGSPQPALREEDFAVPVGKLRFSFAGARERSGARGDPREEPFTLKTWKPRTSALIDQEIREALEREEELKAQRRKAGGGDPPGPRTSSHSSAASGVTGSYSACPSPVFSPPPWRAVPEGRSPHEPDPQSCLSPSRRRRDNGKYAGIELGDEIDTEVVQSIKPICRRGVLAQMWETGQIRHIDDNDDDDGDDGRP